MGLFGSQSVSLLGPLLEQGLRDEHETVLGACLRALGFLQRRGLFSTPLITEFLKHALDLTAHPSAYIRQVGVFLFCSPSLPRLEWLG